MYKKEKRSWMKHWDFTLLDIGLVQLAFLISYAIRFELGWAYGNELYWHLTIVTILIQVCITFFAEPYKNILRRDKAQELKAVVKQNTMLFLGIVLFIRFCKKSNTNLY